jgi:Actin
VLFSQIVLSGGTTLFPGFGDRLLSEIKTHPNSPKNTKIRISAPTERLSSVWIGKISHFLCVFLFFLVAFFVYYLFIYLFTHLFLSFCAFFLHLYCAIFVCVLIYIALYLCVYLSILRYICVCTYLYCTIFVCVLIYIALYLCVYFPIFVDLGNRLLFFYVTSVNFLLYFLFIFPISQ